MGRYGGSASRLLPSTKVCSFKYTKGRYFLALLIKFCALLGALCYALQATTLMQLPCNDFLWVESECYLTTVVNRTVHAADVYISHILYKVAGFIVMWQFVLKVLHAAKIKWSNPFHCHYDLNEFYLLVEISAGICWFKIPLHNFFSNMPTHRNCGARNTKTSVSKLTASLPVFVCAKPHFI